MVRVGGGWDSLDHFLLKHDPCRVHAMSGTYTHTTSVLFISYQATYNSSRVYTMSGG